MSAIPRIAVALLLCLAARSAPAAEQGGMCNERSTSVLIVLVPSAQQVKGAAQGLSKTKVLVDARDTVIFADGRVVTSNLDSVSDHLNTLGWAARPLEIATAGKRPGPALRRG